MITLELLEKLLIFYYIYIISYIIRMGNYDYFDIWV